MWWNLDTTALGFYSFCMFFAYSAGILYIQALKMYQYLEY